MRALFTKVKSGLTEKLFLKTAKNRQIFQKIPLTRFAILERGQPEYNWWSLSKKLRRKKLRPALAIRQGITTLCRKLGRSKIPPDA
jgi:hypothetical protein